MNAWEAGAIAGAISTVAIMGGAAATLLLLVRPYVKPYLPLLRQMVRKP